MTLTPVNDAPVLSGVNGETSAVVNNNGDENVDLFDDAVVSDVDSSDFNGGSLTITQNSGTSNGNWYVDGTSVTSGGDSGIAGSETIMVGGLAIGTVSSDGQGGSDLIITFDTANATPANIQTLLRSLRYESPSGLGDRGFGLDLDDGTDTTSATFTISITGQPPVIADLDGDSLTFTENDGATALDSGAAATVTDADSSNFDGGNLTVSYQSGQQAEDRIEIDTSGTVTLSAGMTAGSTVSVGATVIGTIDSGATGGASESLTITLNSNATPALVQELVRALQYNNVGGDNPTDGDRVVRISVTDTGTNSATGTADVTINVNPVNDTPSFGGNLTASLNEDTDTVGGTATVSDADTGESSFNADSVTGTYGDLAIAANGDWFYDLDESDADVQGLLTGETLGDTLTVSSADGTTQDIVITISGVSDPATFGGTLTNSLNEDTDTVGGTATVSDVDGADSFNADTVTGTYGDLTIAANGDWVYDLDEANTDVQGLLTGETLGDTLTVSAADGTTQTISITINGVNDAPSFGGALTGSLNEDTDTLGGTATVSDADSGQASFNADTVTGTYGDLTIAANGDWVYDLDEANTDVQALGAGETLGDTLTVSSADGTTQTITITINGVEDTAVFGGNLTGSLNEDTDTVTGTATVSDPESADLFTADTVTGTYGDLAIVANGDWTYDLDEANTDVQALGAGETLGDTLTVSSADGTTQTITITIGGVNDTAVFGGNLTGSLNEDADSIGGTATVTDPESANSFNTDTIGGTYGDLTIAANGDWVYDLDEANTDVQGLLTGETLGDTLTVSSADGTTQDIVITISGVNDAPVFGGDLTASMNEDDTVTATGTATVSDADASQDYFGDAINGMSVTGTYGSLTIAANGDWTYDLDEANSDVQALGAGDTLGDTLTVTSGDGTSQDIVITINGVNDTAVFGGTLSANMDEDTDTVGGTATVSDVDTGEAAFSADTLDGSYGSLSIDASGDWVYDLDEANTDVQALAAGDTLGDTVTVSSADGTTQDITITITGVNDAPQSAGGSVDASEGVATTFSASDFAFSDVDTGDSLQSVRIDTLPAAGSLQLSGVAVTAGQVITVANIANLTYTPADDDDVNRSFTFSVNDGTAWSASATMTLDVTSANDAPSRPRLETSGVTENEAGALVGTLSAIDPEGDDVTFVVNDSRFRIEGDKLYLASGTSFDYESAATVTVRVFAYDEEGLYSSAFVDIPVINVVNEGGNTETGTTGSDTIRGSVGGDTLMGGGGNDQLHGGAGDDVISQNDDDDGADIIVGGEGNDSINAGGGNDFVVGGGATDGSTRQSLDEDSDPNDRGADTIRGGSGDDTILGGGWNDDLVDDDGWYTDGEEVEGDTDQNRIWAGSGQDIAAGSGGDDRIGGSTGQDTLKGLSGDDTLFGNDDNDSLLGGNGDDLLYGGRGDDTVDGGAGDDRLWAGAGDDLFTGGDGSDTFIFGAAAGNDTITDFDVTADALEFHGRFDSAAEVVAAASETSQDGTDGVLIDLGSGESVFLAGVTLDQLSGAQMTF